MHPPSSPILPPMCWRACARAPRVHCITNTVAQNYTANMLLAAGAMPSMTISPEEIGSFVAGADSLLVNLGTFDPRKIAAIAVALRRRGAAACRGCSIRFSSTARPAARSSPATSSARGPAVVRLNAAEFAPLSGGDPADEAAGAVRRSLRHDRGADRRQRHRHRRQAPAVIANGDPLMALVTGWAAPARRWFAPRSRSKPTHGWRPSRRCGVRCRRRNRRAGRARPRQVRNRHHRCATQSRSRRLCARG